MQAYRANALFDAHRDDPEFGYRLLVDEAADAGQPMATRTAWRICSQNGWWSAFGKPKRGKNGKPRPPVHEDLVQRDFTADAPNQLWLTDITEHRTAEGRLYLCAIKDVHPNRIVGYSIDAGMTSRLAGRPCTTPSPAAPPRALTSLPASFTRTEDPNFEAENLVLALHRHTLVESMGRVGAAGDNAAMESFFALLQNNVLDRQAWTTRDELRIAIVTWIERTYHRRRRQAGLGRLTPIEYEAIMPTPATQAA